MNTVRKNSMPELPAQRAGFSLVNMPIKYRLPLLIGTLLLGLILACVWASYRAVKDSALQVGRDRLLSLTQQLAAQTQQGLPLILGRTATAANDTAVRQLLLAPSPATHSGALASLQQFSVAQDPSSLQVELWNANRSLALTVPDGSSAEPADLGVEFKQCAIDPFRAVGPIRVVNGVVAYTVAAAVKDDAGKLIGYFVRWRRVAQTQNVRQQLGELLGSQATVYYGNTQGDLWTDLEKPVPKPLVSSSSPVEISHYTRRDGTSVMGLQRVMPGTPWSIIVEFPDQAFLSQANRFLSRMLMISLALIALGLAGALVLSRSITRPLQSFAKAASAVSEGDYSRTVDLRRADELGTLATLFNAMVVKVRDSQRELRRKALLFEDSPLPMWVFDRKTLAFLAVNEAAIRTYGFSRQEFLSMTITDIRPAEEVPRLLGELARLDDEPESNGCWKHRKKDGDLIDVQTSSHSIDFNGSSAQLVLANDVTNRIRAQEALQSKSDELAAMTQQLWQASKLATMGELAASIAHELNNPLAIVSLRAETLLEQLSGDEPKQRSLEIIISEVDRMASLVTNLLQFTRRSHRQISTVEVGSEIANSIDFVSYYLRNLKIAVVKQFEDSLPAIHADRQQLRQLFLNLVTNACDAMPTRGTLTVRAGNSPEAGVVIEFADTGNGISAEELEKIWEPFYTSKPEGKGTGLGLSICRRIVEEHGGTIDIESEVGKGTTVRVLLPTASQEEGVETTTGALQ
jgi:PAS domain S-box-containing protein